MESIDATLLIAGDGPERARLQQIAEIYGKNIRFKPSYTRDGNDFIVDWRLSLAISSSDLPWRVSGWHEGELSIGSLRVKIATQNNLVPLIGMYRNAASEIVHRVTGNPAVVIVSDDPDASTKISRFTQSNDRIAVCQIARVVSDSSPRKPGRRQP